MGVKNDLKYLRITKGICHAYTDVDNESNVNDYSVVSFQINRDYFKSQ